MLVLVPIGNSPRSAESQSEQQPVGNGSGASKKVIELLKVALLILIESIPHIEMSCRNVPA